jgi:hypothetical protein
MNTIFHPQHLSRQRGMGATIVLFTIALIVLVGAALAYGSRGNSKAFTGESAKVMSSVLLKQSAEYRDAYNRYIFDGGNATNVQFNATVTVPVTGLFDPTKSYGSEQDPPLKAFAKPVAQKWAISKVVTVTGLGAGKATMVYVLGLQVDVCAQVNAQLYGDPSIPDELTLDDTTIASTNATIGATVGGRSTGCVKITSTTLNTPYMFYSTLAKG